MNKAIQSAIIPHNLPTLGQEEKAAAARVLDSGWLAQGPEVEAFENEVCAFLGLPEGHGVAVSSGSAAIFLATEILRLRGSKVGLPAFACNALRQAVTLAGAQPVLCDNVANSANVDISTVNSAEVDGAIIAHMFGIPSFIDRPRQIRVIEDCAQSMGAKIAGQSCGLQGDVGIFSFYVTKLLTVGGYGGMLVSRDLALAEAARDFRAFDARTDGKQRFNLQLGDLQAAIGRVQLRRLPEFLNRRAELFRIYEDYNLPLLGRTLDPKLTPARFRAIVRVTQPRPLIAALKSAGIRAIEPIELAEMCLGADEVNFPNAVALAKSSVSLPLYPALSNSDAKKIASIVSEFLAKAKEVE